MIMRRCLPTIFYTICLILAIGCFYFTLSQGLFFWLHPDELILSQTYHTVGGLLACTKSYYLTTTINRLSADFSACLLAKGVTLFSTPYLGWIFGRLIVYVLITVSLAFALREVFKIPFILTLTATLLILTATLLAILHYGPCLYGLDLAIYGTATVSFFALITLFPKSIEKTRYFVGFCMAYAVNLTSHEIFLVISGFFIPLFAWHHYQLNHSIGERTSILLFIKNALRNKKVWILFAIYLIGALITILAPGVGIRQQTWPSTGTLSEGFVHAILSVEEVVYSVATLYVLVISLFLLGVIFRLSAAHPYSPKNKLLCGLLLSAPFIYLLVAGFLVGITPTLWGGSLRTEPFRLVEPLLAHFVTNTHILSQGGFYISRVLFLYVGLFLDIFLAGFFIAGALKNRAHNTATKKSWPVVTALFSMFIVVFLFNPDGVGSIRIFPAFAQNPVDLSHYSPQKNQEMHPESSIIQLISPQNLALQTLSRTLFPKNNPGNHQHNITNILVNNYLKAKQSGVIPAGTLDPIYDPTVTDSIAVKQTPWKDLMYALFRVFPEEPCLSFLGEPKPNFFCSNTLNETTEASLLTRKKMTALTPIQFDTTHGMKVKNRTVGCLQLTDIPIQGEHFITSNDISLSKGLYYFVFEAKPTDTELFLYIFGEKRNLFLNWLNSPPSQWGKIGNNDSLVPIFSQVGSSSGLKTLRIVIYSAVDQRVHLRWQHGYASSMIYRGRVGNNSDLCTAKFGKLT